MTREERFVILMARGEPSRIELDETRSLLAVGLEWPVALRLAIAHEVAPLVHRNLRRLGVPGVPSEISDAFEANRRVVAARNALLVREIARVLRILGEAGLQAIPMKGVTLSETLYDDPSLRDCSDMDILVPREHAREALGLLRDTGYASEFTERFFEALLLRGNIEYTLARQADGFQYLIDLHWGIGWGARSDRQASAALWHDAGPVTRRGVTAFAMTPEWEILTLAVHAARHGWPLKWLADVHDYCAERTVSWEKVREFAERFDWLPALQQTLGACHIMLGTPAPPRLVPSMPARWTPTRLGVSAVETPQALLPLGVIGRRGDKLRYLVRQVLVPTLAERRLLRLPSVLGALYYPIRPVRLGSKWGWRLLRSGGRVFRTS